MKHAVELTMKDTSFLSPDQTAVLGADKPLYAIAKQLQWRYPDLLEEDNMVLMMGALHIEDKAQQMVGKNTSWIWMDKYTFSGTGFDCREGAVCSESESHQNNSLRPSRFSCFVEVSEASCLHSVLLMCIGTTRILWHVGSTNLCGVSSIQVLVHNHRPRVAVMSLCAITSGRWLCSLCPSLWWTLLLVPCDGSHELCPVASCSCPWHGSTLRETSYHTCWISQRKLCCTGSSA